MGAMESSNQRNSFFLLYIDVRRKAFQPLPGLQKTTLAAAAGTISDFLTL
jgi:hypothetical protein